jgi:predicted nuclease of predicted toxin-antitoxin system
VKFIVDAQLPPAFAQVLVELGHEADAVRDLGLRDADDGAIWQYALEHGATIVTKDEDFPERSLRSATPPGIIWLRIGNCSNRALFGWFRSLWPEIERRLIAGDPIVEVR